MKPDDEICLCFHVTWRKIINHIRVHRIKQASQLSECFSAGTGCGWCRKQLAKMTQIVQQNPPDPSDLENWLEQNSPGKLAYQKGREVYRQEQNQEPHQP